MVKLESWLSILLAWQDLVHMFYLLVIKLNELRKKQSFIDIKTSWRCTLLLCPYIFMCFFFLSLVHSKPLMSALLYVLDFSWLIFYWRESFPHLAIAPNAGIATWFKLVLNYCSSIWSYIDSKPMPCRFN